MSRVLRVRRGTRVSLRHRGIDLEAGWGSGLERQQPGAWTGDGSISAGIGCSGEG